MLTKWWNTLSLLTDLVLIATTGWIPDRISISINSSLPLILKRTPSDSWQNFLCPWLNLISFHLLSYSWSNSIWFLTTCSLILAPLLTEFSLTHYRILLDFFTPISLFPERILFNSWQNSQWFSTSLPLIYSRILTQIPLIPRRALFNSWSKSES